MKKTLKIEGMHCNGCAFGIESVLKLKGYKAKVDYRSKKAELNISKETDLKKIIKEIEFMGYRTSIMKKR